MGINYRTKRSSYCRLTLCSIHLYESEDGVRPVEIYQWNWSETFERVRWFLDSPLTIWFDNVCPTFELFMNKSICSKQPWSKELHQICLETYSLAHNACFGETSSHYTLIADFVNIYSPVQAPKSGQRS